MNKKGFTLIEVIGVVTVLSIILIVAVPSLTKTLKRNQQNKYNNYIDNLKIAAENYVVEALKSGETINETMYITLGDLIDADYVKDVMTNPENDSKLSRDTRIKIARDIDGTLKYDVQENYVLPESYQLVEYIESTGTQYIDTGYIPNQDTGFDMVFLSKDEISSTTGEFGSIFGARQKSMERELQLTTYTNDPNQYSGTLRFGSDYNDAGITPNVKMHISLMNQEYTNYSDKNYSFSEIFESPVTLTIFAIHDSGGSKYQNGSVQLYSLKLYDGDILVRDFVPCYRKSDNVVGLYDTVNNKFYTNSGTGEFITEADV